MIQVSIPASVLLKDFDYNTEVEIINPVADTVATATYQGVEVDWFIKAEDIILRKATDHTLSQSQQKKDVLYYDCTNYYFEVEQEVGEKKYGKGNEHRPNPIIQMGLFTDGDGIPLALLF